uniref:uncharacterized protein LOC122600920 isoform X2 n=1 Tax=Erigeron canadensis TaxID=72917 RepID=UPI001CB993EE|nr:uncharacterized protein LOC122600920 isoform X2 [Erigeron canadensis]
MHKDGNDPSKKKMKQGTLDSFLNVQSKRKIEDGLVSSSDDSSSESENGLDLQENQDIEMGTMSDSDGGADFDLDAELQLWENDHTNFGELMKITLEYSTRKVYRPPLLNILVCLRYILQQGLEIHGHEDEGLGVEGNFISLLKMLAKYDESIDEAVIENASLVHKDRANSCAKETSKAIVKD